LRIIGNAVASFGLGLVGAVLLFRVLRWMGIAPPGHEGCADEAALAGVLGSNVVTFGLVLAGVGLLMLWARIQRR
jgi:hypothetical protein